ncbi:MAG TPA: hypothetical protein VLG15_03300 [Thermoanaerobaculia bacterium]|nr:hypothetical protein [Thermoanaerobaculia bacterium]
MHALVATVLLALLFGGAGANPLSPPVRGEKPAVGEPDSARFGKYWYQGKAELTRYKLEQARYGELHSGESVLIFVTEPFLAEKQVKLERGDPSKGITVLKLNFVRKFFTGIYPYSMMTSTFTPVDFAKTRTLKVTSESQEWCGQTFTQLNLRGGRYSGLLRSYFEDEGDQGFDFAPAWLEDELWTRIRLAPATLPTGDVSVVPGLQYARLWHKEVRPERARATLAAGGEENVYTLDYGSLPRKLVIRFEKAFPWKITSWEETQPGAFDGSPLLTTKAVATGSLMLDYWRRHGNADAHYRKELGLTMW